MATKALGLRNEPAYGRLRAPAGGSSAGPRRGPSPAAGRRRAVVSGRARRGGRKPPLGQLLAKLAEQLSGEQGCAGAAVIVDRRDGVAGHSSAILRIGHGGTNRGKGRERAPRYGSRASMRSTVLTALGHATRFRILCKLLEGPATYRALQKLTRMKAGPLYHHINQLRLARLILPRQRDLYSLTRGGRNAVVVAHLLAHLSQDARSRPEL